MRIAIDGTHSVGKTTLHEALKSVLINWDFIPETVRQVTPNFALETPDDWLKMISDQAKYINFMQVMIDYQLRLEKSNSFIVDGSLYRVIAYANVAGINALDQYLDHIEYDLIMYCPIEFDFVNDGFRFSENCNEVDSKLQDIIKEHHKGKVINLKGSITDRIHTSLKMV